MKVLMTGPDLSYGIGGQVTHLKNIKSCFLGCKDIKVEFFFTSKGLYNSEPKIDKLIRSVYSILIFFFKLWRFDVIHINTTLDNRCCLRDIAYSLISIISMRVLIIQVHGGSLSRISLLSTPLIKWFYRFILSHSSTVFVLTKKQKNDFETILNIPTTIVFNYVENPKIDFKIKSNNTPVRFLYLSRIEQAKGIFELIYACKKLANSDFEFYLNIAGDGPELYKIKELVSELNIENLVNFYGYVEGNKKTQLFIESDVFILPSYSEGLPYSVLEGLTYALPMVLTPVGALPDIITEGKEAFFVDIGDSKSLSERMKMFADFDLLMLMSAAALERSQQFSYVEMRRVFSHAWSAN